MKILRPYQIEAIENLRSAFRTGHKSLLLVMPTGSGKSLTSAALIRSAESKRKRVLFLSPRREIVYQIVEALNSLGVHAGMVMAQEKRSAMADTQVASINTLHRRCVVGNARKPDADLIVIDEAHTMLGKMITDVLAMYPGVPIIGMTATPARSDGRGLGEIYDEMILGPSVAELTQLGHLVPVRYFAPSSADLSGVRMQAGDYHRGDLEKLLTDSSEGLKLIGDVVGNWQRIASDRKTVVFAVNRAHAMALHQAFSSAGYASEYIDGNTPNDERKEILGRIHDGRSQVLCSVDVVSYGWDSPSVSCGIIARPTKSLARYIQSAGRILRPHPESMDAILIDHTGCVEELGFLDDEQPWSLLGDEKIQDRKEAKERKEPKPITCWSCKAMMEPAHQCPNCGADMSFQRAKAIKAHEADLQEVKRKEKKSLNQTWSMEEKRRFFGELKAYADQKGYKRGWAAHTYKERLSVWPNKVDGPPVNPSSETLAWLKHMQIKKAKQAEKKRAAK